MEINTILKLCFSRPIKFQTFISTLSGKIIILDFTLTNHLYKREKARSEMNELREHMWG